MATPKPLTDEELEKLLKDNAPKVDPKKVEEALKKAEEKVKEELKKGK